MRWTALESKMLSAIAYDGSKRILYLRFRNTGDVYRYFEFPALDYQAFLSAESLPLRAHGQTQRRLITPRRFSSNADLILWWRPIRPLR
jgi:hypothetical protein